MDILFIGFLFLLGFGINDITKELKNIRYSIIYLAESIEKLTDKK